MMEKPSAQFLPIEPDSASIQTHLSMIQGVIARMSTNSSSCKAWCVTVVSAVLVIVADKGKPNFAWIAVLPTIIFFLLDVYYLAYEKAFRQSYNQFIGKLHRRELVEDDLYSISASGRFNKHQWDAIRSFSVWGFYLCLVVFIVLAYWIALTPDVPASASPQPTK
jgi:hypothetical protein